jgi:hypothetical protein
MLPHVAREPSSRVYPPERARIQVEYGLSVLPQPWEF